MLVAELRRTNMEPIIIFLLFFRKKGVTALNGFKNSNLELLFIFISDLAAWLLLRAYY
jgi:hypothetical protein